MIIALSIYFGVTTIITLAIGYFLKKYDSSFDAFFSRRVQRSLCFTKKQSIIICVVSTIMMPIAAIMCYIYLLIRKIARGR